MEETVKDYAAFFTIQRGRAHIFYIQKSLKIAERLYMVGILYVTTYVLFSLQQLRIHLTVILCI